MKTHEMHPDSIARMEMLERMSHLANVTRERSWLFNADDRKTLSQSRKYDRIRNSPSSAAS